jgi:glyoxylase-like metal-dependent hydrolase (beta-lactamase superfamily II)
MSMLMTKRHRYQGRILGFMLALWPAWGLAEEGAIPFPLTEVAPGIYVHQGLHEDYSQNNHGDIANLGFIVGSRCVSVLDSGGSLTVGRALRAAIKRTTHVPICYVITSHVHPDHSLGNLAFREDTPLIDRIPALDGSVKGWLSLIEELRDMEAVRVIPGHGPVSAPWPEALAAEQRYLQTLVDEIRALIARGGTLEEAMETVGDSEKDRWILFAQYHKRNVSKVFVELEWE